MNKLYITRRDFLKTLLYGSIYLGIGGNIKLHTKSKSSKKAKVVLIRDANVFENNKLDAKVVKQMLDTAVSNLMNTKNSKDAWKSLIKKDDIVGIKTNVWAYLPTPKELEDAIIKSVIEVGVSKKNIYISDRDAIRVLGKCTALINVRPLRSHHWSGIGGCIKNYIMFVPNPYDYHNNSCENLAAVWKLPIVKEKTRINILDVLTPQFYVRGPHSFLLEWVWKYNGIMVSFDPVAIDAVGAHLLQTKRKLFFGEDRPVTSTLHIRAADIKYNLGVSNISDIELVKLGWQEDVLI